MRWGTPTARELPKCTTYRRQHALRTAPARFPMAVAYPPVPRVPPMHARAAAPRCNVYCYR